MVMQITLISVSIQIVTLIVLLVLTVKLISESARNLTVVFLSFFFALWLLTDMYWIIYDLMRPDARMPFAANEIGEAAMFLSAAATINSVVKRTFRLPVFYHLITLIFAASNVALWIVWSGEIVQDLITGAVFTWLFFNIVRSIKWSQALAKTGWIILFTLCAALIICQGLTLTVPEGVKNVPDLCAYFLMIAGIIFFAQGWIRAHRGGTAYVQLSLSFALVTWVTMAKYMSDGNWYNLFMTTETIGFPLLYMSVRKVVKTE